MSLLRKNILGKLRRKPKCKCSAKNIFIYFYY
uniref:Uncharacterized protein n=1 Tax=Anguilla anguilla TaxID=7936 RepID=A0A0E9W020_ANGAN